MLSKSEAIQFLQQNQPLPSDGDLSKEIIDKFDKVREYFLKNPDSDCISLFLNSFGDGSGFGVYQMIEDVMKKHPKEQVISQLTMALTSEFRGVRYWNTQIAAVFPDKSLVEPLQMILQENDSDMRYAAITALQQIEDVRIKAILKDALKSEDDEEIIELINEALSELEE